MNILVVNSSPKSEGIITTILRSIISGLTQNANIEYLETYKLSAKPCIGCMKCRPNNVCILPQDDGHRFGEALLKCNGIIIGAPTYWSNMPAPLKLLLDRNVTSFIHDSNKGFPTALHKGKPAIIVTACTAPYPINTMFYQSSGTLKSISVVLQTSGFKIIGSVVQPGCKDLSAPTEKVLLRAKLLVSRFSQYLNKRNS